MNVYSKSKNWKEKILSNFASTPFVIKVENEEYKCASVEGFWQGLKCKGDMRLHVFGLTGMYAKRAGKRKNTKMIKIAGKEFKYGSKAHEDLIREAIKQKVLQNPRVHQVLKESKGKITHKVPGHSKPVIKMENLLMSIRVELFGH